MAQSMRAASDHLRPEEMRVQFGRKIEELTLEIDDLGVVSRADLLDAESVREMELAQLKRRRCLDEIEKIRRALQRIEGNAYGLCINCGEPLNQRRMEIDPVALTCVGCG